MSKSNKAPVVLPAREMVEESIAMLQSLRRRLCVYLAPRSDKFCDCKYVSERGGSALRSRSGEYSGCCEVRAAIAELERVKRAINGGDDCFCQHCGHARTSHSTACKHAGCTCRRFRKKLAIS